MDAYYTAIVFIMSFAMLIMTMCAHNNSLMPDVRKRRFQMLFVLLAITNIAEWYAEYLIGAPSDMQCMHILAKFAELSLTPMIPILSVSAIGGSKYTKYFTATVYINFLLQIVSLFTGVVFSVDVNNMYYRGIIYPLYVALFLCGFVFLIVHCIRFSSHYQHHNIPFLLMIMAVVVLAVVMPFTDSKLRLDWTCVSIASIMFYIYYDQLIQQVDALTGMLNRRSYDCQIESLATRCAIVFFDVDRFKQVNDVYGHNVGDECLKAVAKEIKRSFEKHAFCYRFGGDEFCAIVTFNPTATENLIKDFNNNLQRIRKEMPYIPCVSVGYTIFEPESESISDAVIRADKIMYKNKNS